MGYDTPSKNVRGIAGTKKKTYRNHKKTADGLERLVGIAAATTAVQENTNNNSQIENGLNVIPKLRCSMLM